MLGYAFVILVGMVGLSFPLGHLAVAGTVPVPAISLRTELWTWGISLLTPIIVWAFGKIPQLPRPVLPLITPLVGIVLGLVLRKLGELNLSWVDMAQAGTVAVFIRESINQVITKQLKTTEDSKTKSKPVEGPVESKI